MKRSGQSSPPRWESGGTLIRVLLMIVGLTILAACGGGGGGGTTITTSPAVTLSASSLTFQSGVGVTSAAQTVTVTNSGTAGLTFSGITTSSSVFTPTNTCGTGIAAGAPCTISVTFTPTASGAASGTLTITDNASNSPQTVALSGTGNSVSVSPGSLTFQGVTVGTTSAAQSVTLANAAASAITFSVTAPTGFSPTNTCGSSVAATGTCTINVTFSPTASGTVTGNLTITDSAGTQTVALTGSNTFLNAVAVTVGFGPAGNTGDYLTNYYNGIYTTVTVCEPGTTTCVAVPNVLVDTGSIGLRVLSSALTGVTLSPITDSSGNYLLNECTMYGDGSFNWGPVSLATVQIGGETASQVPGGTANTGIPIQVISTSTVPSAVQTAGQCNTTYGPDDDTPDTLGANGILGIGNTAQDCVIGGVNQCTTASNGDLYWLCSSSGACTQASVPVADQAWNPVAAFSSSDTNGVVLSLSSIPAAGAASDTVTGTLTFGINTETNNGITSQAVYELDEYSYFGSATFNGVTFCTAGVSTCPTNEGSNGTFLDSGSNALFVSDANTLTSALGISVSDCVYGTTDLGYYCPSSTLSIPLEVAGTNGTSTPVNLSIARALDSFEANPSFAAFDNIGGPSCFPATGSPCNTSTDSWDLGLPFFFGNTIFFGIGGTSINGGTSVNGYYAF